MHMLTSTGLAPAPTAHVPQKRIEFNQSNTQRSLLFCHQFIIDMKFFSTFHSPVTFTFDTEFTSAVVSLNTRALKMFCLVKCKIFCWKNRRRLMLNYLWHNMFSHSCNFFIFFPWIKVFIFLIVKFVNLKESQDVTINNQVNMRKLLLLLLFLR